MEVVQELVKAKPWAVPRWSVRHFLVLLVVACLVPGLIGASLLVYHDYLAGRATLERNSFQTTRALSQAVDSHLFKAQSLAQSLATSDSVRRRDFAALYRQARELLALTPLGNSIALSDTAGQQIFNTSREFGQPLPRHGSPGQIRRVVETGQPAISQVFRGAVSQILLVTVDVPVILDGKVVYVVTAVIRPEIFNAILKAQGLPPDWIAGILDSEGTFVTRTHSPEQFIGQKPSPEMSRRIKEAKEDVFKSVTPDGIPVVSIYSRSPATGWTVALGIPRQTLEAEYQGPLLLLVVGMLILFTLGSGMAWLVSEKITRSVRALRAPAQALGMGEMVELPEVHIKEVGEVANALLDASNLLQKRNEALRNSNETLLAREAELAQAHRLAKFGTWYWNLRTGEIIESKSLREVYGREAIPSFPEMRGSLLTIESWEAVNAAVQTTVQTGIGYDLELQVLHGSGSLIWVNAKCEAIRDDHGEMVALRGSIQDITERKEAEAALASERESRQRQLEQLVAERTQALQMAIQEAESLARRDALTGLQNRLSANERLRAEFLRMKRMGRAYSALLMDIDHFKRINDTYGHETGDHVLRQVADILKTNIRATDFAARFGGEEFLVLLPETGTDGALTIAEKIRAAVAGKDFPGTRQVTISVGLSMACLEDSNDDEAVRRADTALYAAKGLGRNRVQLDQ